MPHLRTNRVEQNKMQTKVNFSFKKKYCPRLTRIWMGDHVHLLDPLGWPLLLFMYSTLLNIYILVLFAVTLSIFFFWLCPFSFGSTGFLSSGLCTLPTMEYLQFKTGYSTLPLKHDLKNKGPQSFESVRRPGI
uniref:Uncharacterized protein n=2 Tax=Micrurus paraensis TaxID=1970185 RepID=A0A2D4KAJ9_9SAUR